MTLTIRQRLEAIRDERNRVHMGEPYAAYCESMRVLTAHAVAALAILDEAEPYVIEHAYSPPTYTGMRLVPDPAQPTENT